MTDRKLNNLVQFFGACFHQDWRLDAPTPEAVIERFLDKNPAEEVQKVVVELDELLSLSLPEDELRRMLHEELLCYYLPTETPIRNWLAQLRTSLAGEH
ncbi:MAG: contact-dependent growth inhibition system immunity protein [Verrucomicrobiae bacterium]|nr:contact-dependent growth inhibition system immunity protein [Verrucomicrobiae bacterium]